MIFWNRFVITNTLAGMNPLGDSFGFHKLDLTAEEAKEWLADGDFLNLVENDTLCQQAGQQLGVTLTPRPAGPAQDVDPSSELLVVTTGEGDKLTYQLFTVCLRFDNDYDFTQWPAKDANSYLISFSRAVMGTPTSEPSLYVEEDKVLIRRSILDALQSVLTKGREEGLKVVGLPGTPEDWQAQAVTLASAMIARLQHKNPRAAHRQDQELLRSIVRSVRKG